MEAEYIKAPLPISEKPLDIEADETPEFDRLTILSPPPTGKPSTALKHTYHNFTRPTSPTGSVKSTFGLTRRHIVKSRASWSTGLSRHQHSEISKELTAKAETEFLSLMDLISSMSRRSASLREVWSKILAERSSCFAEMDRMYEQFEEYTESKEKEHYSHHHELESMKKDLTRLRLELSASVTSVNEYKTKLVLRDTELEQSRRDCSELHDNYQYIKKEHDEIKLKLEETQLKLTVSEESRRSAEAESAKYHSELRTIKQQYVELQASHSELTTKYDSVHTEVVSLRQITATLKKEKHEWLHEKGTLEEDIRKCNHRNEETKRKLKEITESYEKKVREVHELHETATRYKHESEELHQKITQLKREVEEEHSRAEDAVDRCSKWKLKFEHSEREIISIREELRIIEVEQSVLRETITKKTDELRIIYIEKEQIEESYADSCKKVEEMHREVLALQESLRRTEVVIKEKTELIHTLNERIERIESERNEVRGRCSELTIEITQLNAANASLKISIEALTEERNVLCEKLETCESKYEEFYQSVSEYQEGSSGYEYEATSLRTMLREVREQKEKAIASRNSADRERDEAVLKYEEKCREVERLEESLSHHLHRRGGRISHGHTHHISGARSVTSASEEEGAVDFSTEMPSIDGVMTA